MRNDDGLTRRETVRRVAPPEARKRAGEEAGPKAQQQAPPAVPAGLTRRDWLSRGAMAVAALGLGACDAESSLDVFKPQLSDLTPGEVCTLTCAQILGPCYYSEVQERHDITEGKPGLPSLLAFLVVDADTCKPVANASIDIWHTDNNGIYSAPISTFCNPGDPQARQQTFCRGVQRTNAEGWAQFKTIYPGWYPGRAPHIHATIRVNGNAMVTTQFYFPDPLSDQIYRNHAAYSHRPNRSTTNTGDGIIGGNPARVNPYLFNSKLILDKSLVALKVIAIRESRTTCNA